MQGRKLQSFFGSLLPPKPKPDSTYTVKTVKRNEKRRYIEDENDFYRLG
jgi:hypothetical protein